MRRHSNDRNDQDSQPEYLVNNTELMEIKKNPEQPKNESNDRTEIINNEIDSEPYILEERKKKYIRFCKERRSLAKARPGRLKLLSENGEQYASIQCKEGDCPEGKTERNELRLKNLNNKNDDFEFNKPYNYKFSFRIPENFPLSPTRLVIGQRKFNRQDESEEKGPSPILAQRIKKIDGKYYLVITDSHRKQLGEKIPFEDIKGKWVDMEYKINFSDKEDVKSSVEVVANIEGKKVKIYDGKYEIRDDENKLKLNQDKPHTGYFKFGLYRDSYDYAVNKLKKDSNLSKKEKKEGIKEIEKARKIENENPMEIHFKNFSMEGDAQPEIERLKGKLDDEQYDKKVEYLARLFKEGNIDEIYSKFLKLDKDYIDYIKNNDESKDISKELEFLQNSNYIEFTEKEYNELYDKVKNDKNISKLLEAIEKQDIEQLISLEKDIRSLSKHIKKLQKYEKGELINLPNGLSFELSTKQEEKSVPENIKLGDNEYFIKTHVEKDADYKQYVSSLLEIRELFKNKGINLKYVKRSTWLVNKDFLKKYEEILKEKFGDNYRKTQRVQVLEDTASAEVFYQIKEGTNPYDEKNEKKNPLRFLKKKGKKKDDLLSYITQDDEHLKSFNEAEMWLDLDKLEAHSQGQGEYDSPNDENIEEETNKVQKGSLEGNNNVRESYADAFLSLVGDNKDLSKIVESLKNGKKMELSIKDIENIYNELNNIKHKSSKDFIDEQMKIGSDKITAKNKYHNLAKFCMDSKAIKEYKTFNYSGVSFIMASIIESLGGTVYMARVYHHVICIAEIQGRQYAIDANNNRNEDITDRVKIEDTECDLIKKFTAKRPLFKEYTEGYVFGSLQEAEKFINGNNYQKMNEPEYEETYKKITELLTEEKIQSYPKNSPIKAEFPEFDRKIYDIEKKKGKANIFGKVKLKAQERLTRIKRRFSRKK